MKNAVIGLYSRGMTTRDIEEQIREIYGVQLHETIVSNLTCKMLESIKEWLNRLSDRFILRSGLMTYRLR